MRHFESTVTELQLTTSCCADDSLACVYYLQSLRVLVFSPEIEPSLRLDSYCCILRHVSDDRDVVALEAIDCLMKHQSAWQIMIDFQTQIHDICAFECVVNRLDECLKRGVVFIRGRGREDQSSGAASLQAACRMCCIVGETLQRAVSFELINFNLNGGGPSPCGGHVFTSEPFFVSPTDVAPVLDGEGGGSSHSRSRTHTPPLVVEDLLLSPLPPPSTSSPIRDQAAALIDPDKVDLHRRVRVHNIDAIKTLCSLLWDDVLFKNQNRSPFSFIVFSSSLTLLTGCVFVSQAHSMLDIAGHILNYSESQSCRCIINRTVGET